MNEKLENEIRQAYFDDLCRVSDCTGLSYGTFVRIAVHFYNLALQDVLQEVEKEIEGKSFAVKMALLDIGAFIDNLTK